MNSTMVKYDASNSLSLIATMAGRGQTLQINVTLPANNARTVLATVVAQSCVIRYVIIRAKSAAPVDLTTCAISVGAADVVSLIGVGVATQANLDAVDKQVNSTNLVELAVGSTIVMDLQGTGSAPVDLVVTIGYEACVNGGYIYPV